MVKCVDIYNTYWVCCKAKTGKSQEKKSKYYIYGVDTLIVNIIKPYGCSYIVTS